GVEYVSLDALLAASDVVSLHLPLTLQTRNMIGRAEFAAMKDGALLINLARGEVVDQEALTEALASGKLGGAGLDVFASEPIDPADPVLRLDNVILSPHIAGTTEESRLRMMQSTFENIRRVATGQRPLNVVNGVE
ncbi:MAG: 2-hydroxyacid dehydrogenase, partial [Candidatus Geothermincolia bacterium]